jgi:NAD(P)-dependent dehydrogenase (short-subunit alcohol dehydrogenase family)
MLPPPAAPPRPPASSVAVVTGATLGGIGAEVAAGLMETHHVVLACRRADACAATAAELRRRRPAGSVACAALDVASPASARAFAAAHPSIALLVNNAGVMGDQPPGSPDAWAVNHLGTYRLTRLLLPAMAPGGRVVTVGSEAHRRGAALRADGGGPTPAGWWPPLPRWYREYAASKLANTLMTLELSRRLVERGSSVTAVSVSPGRVATAIFGEGLGVLRAPVCALASVAFQTPAQGAAGVLRAAVAPELAVRHVLYVHAGKEAEAAPAARDAAVAAALWAASARDAGLTAAEDAALWPAH